MIKVSAVSVYESPLFKQADKKQRLMHGLREAAARAGGGLLGGAAGYGLAKMIGANELQTSLGMSAGALVGSAGAGTLVAHHETPSLEEIDQLMAAHERRWNGSLAKAVSRASVK